MALKLNKLSVDPAVDVIEISGFEEAETSNKDAGEVVPMPKLPLLMKLSAFASNFITSPTPNS